MALRCGAVFLRAGASSETGLTDLIQDRPESTYPILRVAVTGGAGSGKSTVCSRFRSLGAFVVDLDRLARDAVAPGTEALARVIERFGQEAVAENGALDRARLREIIVSDSDSRRDLEAIVHPAVLREMEAALEGAKSAGASLLVAEVPLLFEAGLESRFDRVIVVAAPEKERIRRLVDRDGVSAGQAAALLDVQMPEAEKKNRADHVVENGGRPEELIAAVDRLYRRLSVEAEKEGESA
jgi:dephospho-CoA kinase